MWRVELAKRFEASNNVGIPVDRPFGFEVEDSLQGVAEDAAWQVAGEPEHEAVLCYGAVLILVHIDASVGRAQDAPDEVGISTLRQAYDAMDRGDLDEAKRIAEYARLEWQIVHDMYVNWSWSFFTYIADTYGEAELEKAFRSVLGSYYRSRYDKVMAQSVESQLQLTVEGLRGHLMGRGRQGEIEVTDEPDRYAKSFAAVPHRAAFMGHFHTWLAVTERGRLAWDGTTPLRLEPEQRYLVVIGPLFRGDFAILDTDRWVLEPRRVATGTDLP